MKYDYTNCPSISAGNCVQDPHRYQIYGSSSPLCKMMQLNMYIVGLLHLQTPNHRLKLVQVFIEKNIHLQVDLHSANLCCSRVNYTQKQNYYSIKLKCLEKQRSKEGEFSCSVFILSNQIDNILKSKRFPVGPMIQIWTC